jgi:hypothetical protein
MKDERRYIVDVLEFILPVCDGINHGCGRLTEAKWGEEPVARLYQLRCLLIAA